MQRYHYHISCTLFQYPSYFLDIVSYIWRYSMLTANYVKDTFHYVPETNNPFYAQLASYFRLQIQRGTFRPGERIFPESEMCGMFNISRTTVRLALGMLVDEGLLQRYRGKGTFVTEKKLERNLNYLYTFTDSMRELGSTPSSIVSYCKIEDAPLPLVEKLKLPPQNTKVFSLERIRCADGIPLLIERTRIPGFLCPGIEKTDFSQTSLYATLKDTYSLSLNYAHETIGAIVIGNGDCDKLQCPRKMAGFQIERTSYLFNGIIYEYTTSITRADKCEFQLNLYANQNKKKNSVDISRNLNPHAFSKT